MLQRLPAFIFSVVFTFLLWGFVTSDNPEEKIVSALKKYIEEYPQEKVYLHLDKPYYTAGETIWFKAYLLAGSFHQPSPLSYTIKAELLNQKNEIVQEIKLKSEKGFSNGFFALPDTMQRGKYMIRAYTPWMQNFSEEYFFHKEIKVFDFRSSEFVKEKTADQTVDLQFFPEGGTLVYGLRSKVGYKAISTDGLGKKIQIKIIDQNNTEITRSESNGFGMGFFHFVPKVGDKYQGVIESSGLKFNIPEPKQTGVVMTVTNREDQSEIVLRLQSNDLTKDKDQVIIAAQCRGLILLILKADLSKNLGFIKIPKKNLPPGITHLTLFNSLGLPLTERLIFIDQNDALNVSILPDKPSYKPREKIVLALKATDKNGNPALTNFSLSVTDDAQVFLDPNRETILSNLWLASDVKGHIENPGYYLNSKNADRLDAIDVLLLTQGWRRFVWNEILSDKWPDLKFPIDRGLNLSGRLLDILTKKPVENGKVFAISNEPTSGLMVSSTAVDGTFKFENLAFSDTAAIVLQGQNKRGNKNVLFDMTKETLIPTHYVLTPLTENLKPHEQAYVEQSAERRQADLMFDPKTILLKGVEITGKKIEKQDDYLNIYGKGSNSLKMDDIPGSEGFINPFQALQGRIAGVQVTGSGMDYNIVIRGMGSFSGNTTPLIMLDNMPVDMATISSIPVHNIESIEVFKGVDAAIFGAQGANGAILFYTKRGDYTKVNSVGMYNMIFSGYRSSREFYAPKYDIKLPEHAKPDLRATIFWAPVIQTDSTGNAEVSFYNHDMETTVTGVIEGISSYGQPGIGFFHYEIKK